MFLQERSVKARSPLGARAGQDAHLPGGADCPAYLSMLRSVPAGTLWKTPPHTGNQNGVLRLFLAVVPLNGGAKGNTCTAVDTIVANTACLLHLLPTWFSSGNIGVRSDVTGHCC